MLAALVIVTGASASPSSRDAQWFHSPSKNIYCEVLARSASDTHAFCGTWHPNRCVSLKANGRMSVRRPCYSNSPENAYTLRYGRSVRVGPFRCTSRRDGMRCVVLRSGRGFLISRESLKRF